MSEPQIDPFKLNEVLERILDGINALQEKSSSASPEFQILMSNYLSKANEAERNQARLEESIERVGLKDQEMKKYLEEKQEMAERLEAFQKTTDLLKDEHNNELHALREELSQLREEKDNIEQTLQERFNTDLSKSTEDLRKEAEYYREQFNELQANHEKAEQKLRHREQEAEQLEKELSELRTKVLHEQANIRDEILNVTQKSSESEQKFKSERDHMMKHIRKLELQLEEVSNDLRLKDRELEYKNALLDQTMRKPQPVISSGEVHSQPEVDFQPEEMIHHHTDEEGEHSYQGYQAEGKVYHEEGHDEPQGLKEQIGGIWSKLSK